MITGHQIHQACGLLRWTRHDLNRHTALPLWFVDGILSGQIDAEMTVAEDIVLRDAFDLAGIDFAPERGRRPGPRLRTRPSSEGMLRSRSTTTAGEPPARDVGPALRRRHDERQTG